MKTMISLFQDTSGLVDEEAVLERAHFITKVDSLRIDIVEHCEYHGL